MGANRNNLSFWTTWLLTVSAGVAIFGLLLVLTPGLTNQGFSLLVYANTGKIAGFGAEPLAYISLLHAVLGSVMFSWGSVLFLLVRRLFRQGVASGWNIVALAIVVWFIPDTAYSLWSGFWQNAVLNTVFMILFAIPLAATYRAFHIR